MPEGTPPAESGAPFLVPATVDERTCIRIEPDGSINANLMGQPCASCELYRQTGTCDILAAGTMTLSLFERAHQEQQQRLQERRLHAAEFMDDVIPSFRTGAGMRALIRADTDLASELLAGEWGVLLGDIRGVKDTNKINMSAGDNLLYASAQRMRIARFSPEDRDERFEQRSQPQRADLGFREQGADELGTLLRGVTKMQGLQIFNRIERRFSVEQAINDDQHGILPVLGTFVVVHALDVANPRRLRRAAAEARTAEARQDVALRLFGIVVREARDRQDQIKAPQYGVMWAAVCNELNRRGKSIPDKPSDEREISKHFREICTPNFDKKRRAMLRAAGPHMKNPRQNIDRH